MPYPYEEKEKVILSVLRVLASDVDSTQHAHKSAEAEYADDLLEDAVREYARKLHEYKRRKLNEEARAVIAASK